MNRFVLIVLLAVFVGCDNDKPEYIIDADATGFDFDQGVYVTRRMNRCSSVHEIVAEAERLLIEIYGKSAVDERP